MGYRKPNCDHKIPHLQSQMHTRTLSSSPKAHTHTRSFLFSRTISSSSPMSQSKPSSVLALLKRSSSSSLTLLFSQTLLFSLKPQINLPLSLSFLARPTTNLEEEASVGASRGRRWRSVGEEEASLPSVSIASFIFPVMLKGECLNLLEDDFFKDFV